MAKILGIAEVRFNGEVLETQPGAELTLGGYIKKPRSGHVFHGNSTAYENGKVSGEIMLKKGLSLARIREIEEATLVFSCDSGQVYSSASMATSEALTVTDGGDSKVKVTLEGAHFEEITE
ncbi:phage tail tube protein [Rhodospirillum sp. A1_3_36]|uniref:phage tail tube protein n=1 Tax=Rhodospirillum sp. A1_3_36 TaxID=3391666 RepID=UPI0039A558AD